MTRSGLPFPSIGATIDQQCIPFADARNRLAAGKVLQRVGVESLELPVECRGKQLSVLRAEAEADERVHRTEDGGARALIEPGQMLGGERHTHIELARFLEKRW